MKNSPFKLFNKKLTNYVLAMLIAPMAMAQQNTDQKIEELLGQMTLQEKVGQLNFIVGDLIYTGPTAKTNESDRFNDRIKKGEITGIFNIYGAEYTKKLQKIAMEESRLKIPLLIGADVIHGFKTIFPIPLAEAASWDMEAIKKSAEIAAKESSASGISMTFAPMVDVSRDPRWGRMAEGSGEDVFLGAAIAKARVEGFQGDNLKAPHTVAACVKHFAAYGAPLAGRDYNPVDMSERTLREIYLPPYKAAIDAGSATLMTSFNDLNGIPATGNEYLMKQILRTEWGYNGMVVSDWTSINEMINHGYAEDREEAGLLAIKATTDMDMMGEIYFEDLPKLVNAGKLDVKIINDAVRRVLKLKFDLGLFDNPYLYSDTEREKKEVRNAEHLAIARDVAKKSIVLLKNDKQVLPLKKSIKSIAVIGPLADNKADMNGTWSIFGESEHPVTILEGIKAKLDPATKVYFAEGCNLYDNSTDKFKDAIKAAKKAEVIVLAIGESAVMNGEAASRSSIRLPGIQEELVKELHKTGKPIIALLTSGRALAIEWLDENIPAILATWTLGSESGNAIADVLFGDYNPSAKLPVTFPRNEGQIPIYYSYKITGRPYTGNNSEPLSERVYQSKYRDTKNTPLYPFGHGLSYSKFEYSDLKLSANTISPSQTLTITVTVSNKGQFEGNEVVQMYIQDLVGSVTRPVKELKGFEKIFLKPGESKTVSFTITSNDLAFYRQDMSFGYEPGKFKVYVGTSSQEVLEAAFALTEK